MLTRKNFLTFVLCSPEIMKIPSPKIPVRFHGHKSIRMISTRSSKLQKCFCETSGILWKIIFLIKHKLSACVHTSRNLSINGNWTYGSYHTHFHTNRMMIFVRCFQISEYAMRLSFPASWKSIDSYFYWLRKKKYNIFISHLHFSSAYLSEILFSYFIFFLSSKCYMQPFASFISGIYVIRISVLLQYFNLLGNISNNYRMLLLHERMDLFIA